MGVPQKWMVYNRKSYYKWMIYGKSPVFMGKSTNSMAIFISYVKLPEGSW
jgi:hypothetical protein